MNPDDLGMRPRTPGSRKRQPSSDSRSAAELAADLQVHQLELEMQNQELRETQLALELSRQRYFSLFDLAPVPYFLFSEELAVEEVNLVATELLGADRQEVVNRPFSLFLTEESRPIFHDQLRRIFRDGGNVRTEFRLVNRAGSLRHIVAHGAPLPHDGVHQRQALLTCVDVTTEREAETTRKELERELRQSQKMEALGLLAGGMAHDFNNLLQAILGFTDYAYQQTNNPAIRDALDQVLSATDRAAQLTRQILAFSSRQPVETHVLCMNNLVAELTPMLSRLVGPNIDIRTSLEPSLPSIACDRGQIEQVLMNLIVNARDAIEGSSGRVEVSTALRPMALAVKGETPGASRLRDAVALIVRDTGIGMSPETIARIFEPFFTTKNRARGTGLGLSVVHGIIQQHSGEIRVESRVGAGTTFTILLPVSTAEAIPTRSPTAPRRPGRGECILLAEDEPGLRQLTISLLESFGYRVLVACDGIEAVEVFRQHRGDPIALLLFDIIMPRLSGLEAYQAIREIGPCPPVLFVSGYAGDAPLQTDEAKGIAFLRKPFREPDLHAKISACLAAVRPAAS